MQKRVSENAFHGMRLSRGCLSVGKDGSIISAQDVFNNGFGGLTVDLLLRCIWFEYFVKDVNFALKKDQKSNQRFQD